MSRLFRRLRIRSLFNKKFSKYLLYAVGEVLILIFGIWLKWLPAVSVFLSDDEIFTNPQILILPILTLTAVELGYVARMTRASMVDVMRGLAFASGGVAKNPYL